MSIGNVSSKEIIVSRFIIGLLVVLTFSTIIFLLVPLYLYSKKITFINMDAKYSSWFSRRSIKNIESIDTFGFSVFNRIIITGKGGTHIKMYFVANFDDVKKFAEEIENFKG